MKRMYALIVIAVFSVTVFSQNTILIQGAMDVEISKFLENMKNKEQIESNNFFFWRGKLSGKDVVISKTEIGPVNTAISTCIAIEKFNPVLIINQGTSGAIVDHLHRKDIVLGEYCVDYSGSRTNHLDYGQGSNSLKWIPLSYSIGKTDYKKIECDRFYLDQAKKVDYKHGKVITGTIGSAFQWNRELDRLKWINETYGIICEEMETAISAMTAKVFGIDFIGIRIISDNEVLGEEFQPELGHLCSEFIMDYLKNLKFRVN